MADVQGKDLPLILSDDSFTTSYTIVCLTQGGVKNSYSVNTEESQCGVHTGIGSPAFSVSFSAIVKTDPTAASCTPSVGEASYKKLLTWATAQTKLSFKVSNGTLGANFYQSGEVYLNDLSLDWQVGQTVKCSGTLTGTGVVDVTP